MKSRVIRISISAVIFGLLFAGGIHRDHLKGRQLGREKFLAKQAIRFDRHFASPDSIGIQGLACVFFAGGLFSAYELVAFGISKALKKVEDHKNNS